RTAPGSARLRGRHGAHVDERLVDRGRRRAAPELDGADVPPALRPGPGPADGLARGQHPHLALLGQVGQPGRLVHGLADHGVLVAVPGPHVAGRDPPRRAADAGAQPGVAASASRRGGSWPATWGPRTATSTP